MNAPGLPPAALSASLDAIVKRGSADHAKAREAAKEFESVFLATMLNSMFEGVDVPEPFGGGHAEQQYRGLLIAEYGKDLSAGGGIGLADHVFREILAAQESAQ